MEYQILIYKAYGCTPKEKYFRILIVGKIVNSAYLWMGGTILKILSYWKMKRWKVERWLPRAGGRGWGKLVFHDSAFFFLQDDSSKDLLHSENTLHVLNIHLKTVTMV